MKVRISIIIAILSILLSLLFTSCQSEEKTSENADVGDNANAAVSQIQDNQADQNKTEKNGQEEEDKIAEETSASNTKMLYQGHASFRITANDGTVIYIDPYAGEGYDIPADIILVTHQHDDHNKVKLVTQKDECTLISNKEAFEGGVHNTFSIKGIEIEAVEANNKNHNPKDCVGYIITVDGIKIYHAGDTSKIDAMDSFAEKSIDYALLPCDGVFNMNAKEAAECAKIINAKHNIPIHTKVGELFNLAIAESFDAPNRLIVNAGEEIVLEK